MDSKERAIVAALHGRIQASAFGESDVLGFLIATREYAHSNSPLRELGDFVAHRERDRGILQRYLRHVCEFRDAFLAGLPAILHSEVIFSLKDLHATLTSTLQRFDLPSLNEAQTGDLLACAMSILQQVRLSDGKKQIGRLALGRTATELQLLGLVHVKQADKGPIEFAVPALIVPNRYCAGPLGTTPTIFQEPVEARWCDGMLKLYVNGSAA